MIKANRDRSRENRGKSFNSKAMGAIVATSLLIVVTVVASIGFQGWFVDFESGLTTEVEKQSMNTQLRVDGIFGDTLYLYSGDNSQLSSLKIVDNSGNEMCSFKDNEESFNKLNNDSSLVGWWTLDEIINQSGKIIIPDLSGNENYGIFHSYFTVNITDVSNIFINLSKNTQGIKLRYFVDNHFKECIVEQNSSKYKIISDITYNQDNVFSQRTLEINDSGLNLGLANITCNFENNFNKKGQIYFDGIDDFIHIQNNNLGENLNYNYSFFIIFKPEKSIPFYLNNELSYSQTILSFRNLVTTGSMDRKAGMINLVDSSKLRLIVRGNESPSQNVSISNQDISFNKWQRISLIKNNDIINLYLNNKNLLEMGLSTQGITGITDDSLFIGKHLYNTESNGFYKGYIDEIRIYNRTLSEEEISTLYWYSIKNNQEGVNQLDISSCNLNKGEPYNVLAIDDNQVVSSTLLKR